MAAIQLSGNPRSSSLWARTALMKALRDHQPVLRLLELLQLRRKARVAGQFGTALGGSLPSQSFDQLRHVVGSLAVETLHLTPGLLGSLSQSGTIAMVTGDQAAHQAEGKAPSSQAREQYLLLPCRG